MVRFCFVTETRVWGRLISGNKGGPRGMKGSGQVLTSRNISSLVIDTLCDQARGQNAAVACFYFDFAAQKEQSSTSMLGALLKQAVGVLGEVPEEIAQAYEEQKAVISGRGPRVSFCRHQFFPSSSHGILPMLGCHPLIRSPEPGRKTLPRHGIVVLGQYRTLVNRSYLITTVNYSRKPGYRKMCL